MLYLPIEIEGHCLITDECERVHLNQTNSIHHVNMSRIIGRALAHEPNCGIKRIAFGDGGTFYKIDTTSNENAKLVYKPVITSTWKDKIYNEIYSKHVNIGNEYDTMSVDKTTSGSGCVRIDKDRIAQVVITCKLNRFEFLNQNKLDTDFDTPEYVFDEIGLYTDGIPEGVENLPCDGKFEQERLLTHLIFSPILKTQNREFNIKYTLTIYIPKTKNVELIVIKPYDQTPPTIALQEITDTKIILNGTVGEDMLVDGSIFKVMINGVSYTPTFDKFGNWELSIDILPPGVYTAYAVRTNPDGKEYYSNIINIDLTVQIYTPTVTNIEAYPGDDIELSGTLGGSKTNTGFSITFNNTTISTGIIFNGNNWSYKTKAPNNINSYDITAKLKDQIGFGILNVKERPVLVDADEALTGELNKTLSVNLLANADPLLTYIKSVTIGNLTKQIPTNGTATFTLASGTFVIKYDGSFTFTPTADYSGSVPNVSYIAANATSQDTSTLNISSITGKGSITATGLYNEAITFQVLEPGYNWSIVRINVASGVPVIAGADYSVSPGGNIKFNTDGTVTFTPTTDYVGPVPLIQVDIVDANGNKKTIDIKITDIAIPPLPTMEESISRLAMGFGVGGGDYNVGYGAFMDLRANNLPGAPSPWSVVNANGVMEPLISVEYYVYDKESSWTYHDTMDMFNSGALDPVIKNTGYLDQNHRFMRYIPVEQMWPNYQYGTAMYRCAARVRLKTATTDSGWRYTLPPDTFPYPPL